MGTDSQNMAQQQQGMPTQEQMMQQQAKEMEEKKTQMMSQICTQDALDRIGRIKVVKPEKSAEIENMLLQMAVSGKLQGQVDDEALKKLLAADGQANQTSVQMKRRNIMDDDDW